MGDRQLTIGLVGVILLLRDVGFRRVTSVKKTQTAAKASGRRLYPLGDRQPAA
jgi:hypothetical protein